MDREEKKNSLEKAFADPKYQKQLMIWRNELEKKLGEFISWLRTQLSEEQKIIESMEMRIKSETSFREKLDRKDYVTRWPEGGTQQEWQHIISTNLTDIIGFRINCYFYKDERIIYDKLKQYVRDIGWKDIVIDFGGNTTQANGHSIYKVDGVYRDAVCFELQIKSMIHNIWGEVDHRTIYKQRDYDIDPKGRAEVTEQVFEILKASDMQLLTLYRQDYSEQRIIEALFYKQTASAVAELTGTKVLARHYDHFFRIFFNGARAGLSDQIRDYIAQTLIGKKHRNREYRRDRNDQENLILQVMELLARRYIAYDILILKRIASQVIYFRSNDDFFYFLAQELVGLYMPAQDSVYEEDAFGEEDAQSGAWDDLVRKLDTIFKKRG